MDRNDAHNFMAHLLTEEFRNALVEVVGNSMDKFNECRRDLPTFINLVNNNRLIADISAACIRAAFLEFHWNDFGLRAVSEISGAYPCVDLLGEDICLVMANSSSFKPNNLSRRIRDCIVLNTPRGREGRRGVILFYDLCDDKTIKTVRLAMRHERNGELVSVPIFPDGPGNEIVVRVG